MICAFSASVISMSCDWGIQRNQFKSFGFDSGDLHPKEISAQKKDENHEPL